MDTDQLNKFSYDNCRVIPFLYYEQKELLGQSLLEVVYARLNLLETSYFGLRYLDFEGQTVKIAV